MNLLSVDRASWASIPTLAKKRSPKIFGEVSHKGIQMTRTLKDRVDGEMLAWIQTHLSRFEGSEIQYWVSFNWLRFESKVNCRVGIISESGTWEANEFSGDPLSALESSLCQLTPSELQEIA